MASERTTASYAPHKVIEVYGQPLSEGQQIFGMVEVKPPWMPCMLPDAVREYAAGLLAAAAEAESRNRIARESA